MNRLTVKFIKSTERGLLIPQSTKYEIMVNNNSLDHMIPVYIEFEDDILEGEYRFGDHPDYYPYFYECIWIPGMDKYYGTDKFSSDIRIDKETGCMYIGMGYDFFPIYLEDPLPDIGSLTIH